MQTALVYSLHAALWSIALRRVGFRPCVVVLAIATMASWFTGEVLDDNARAVGMILIDLATILALAEFRASPHDRLVAAISLSLIVWRSASYVIVSYMGHYPYAVAINCVVAAQLLIAGGFADDLGRRLDRWIDRLPRGIAGAVRNVAS